MRLAVDDLQHVHALGFARHELPQARLHHFVPDGGVVTVAEALGLADRPRDHGAQFRIALLIGVRHRGAQERGDERQFSGADASE